MPPFLLLSSSLSLLCCCEKKEDRIKERRAKVIHPFVFALAFTRLQYIDLLYMYLSGLLIMYCAWIKHYALYRIRDCFLLLDLSC